MILDKENAFSLAQAVTTSAASTDYMDLTPLASGADDRDIGQGEGLRLVITVDETVQSTGSSTVTFALQTDDTSTFGSATTLYTSGAVAKATLVAGYKVCDVPIPKGVEKYLRVYYTVATADLTEGEFTAVLVKDSQDVKSYPAGYSIGSGA